MDPYSVLGISKDSDITDIKKAYHKLSLQFHPDRNPSIEAKSRILEINEAYEILGDQESKKKYDHLENMKNIGDLTDLTDIFHMMYTLATKTKSFSTSSPSPSPPPPSSFSSSSSSSSSSPFFSSSIPTSLSSSDVNIQIPIIDTIILITMRQSYYGCTLPITIKRQNGMDYETETLYIKLQQGIDNNDSLLLKNRGNRISGNHIGDVNVIVNIQNITNFKRIGMDLLYKKTISLKEALCGVTFEIEHINGKKLLINNVKKSSIIYPNYQSILPGYGMRNKYMVGNLIIEFEIEFPSTLSKDQIQSLENIL